MPKDPNKDLNKEGEPKKPESSKPDKRTSYNSLIKKISKNPYEIPERLIEELAEHTSAFWLFSMDHNGNLGIYNNADNELVSDGLLDRAVKTVQLNEQMAMQQMAIEMARAKGLIPNNNEEEEEE